MPVGIGWIIRARGLAPSIGAGGTIVVAVLCCLVFASALLTFRSWPSADGGAGTGGTLQVRVPEAKAAGHTEARPAPKAAAAGGVAARPARRTRVRGAARPRSSVPPARFAPSTPVASSPRPAAPRPVAAAPAQPTTPAPTAGASDPVAVPPTLPAGSAEQTVTTVRGVVDDVIRPVPVPPAGQQTLGTVQGAAQTVDELLP